MINVRATINNGKFCTSAEYHVHRGCKCKLKETDSIVSQILLIRMAGGMLNADCYKNPIKYLL